MGPDTRVGPEYRDRPLCWPATVTVRTGDGPGGFPLVLGSATPRDELRELVADAQARGDDVARIVVDSGVDANGTVATWQPGRIETVGHERGWRTVRQASDDAVDGLDQAIAAAGADGRPLCEYCTARAQRRLAGPAGRWACRAHLHLALVDANRDPRVDSPIRIERRRVVCTDAEPAKTVTCGTCGHEVVIPADEYTCPLCAVDRPGSSERDEEPPGAMALCGLCRYGRHPYDRQHPGYCTCPCREQRDQAPG